MTALVDRPPPVVAVEDSRGPLDRLRRAAARELPADSAAVARIAFGAVAAASAARLLGRGWVSALWLEPEVLLGWPVRDLPLPPGPVLHALVAALGVLGLAIAAGAWTRPAAGLFAVGLGYLELLDRTTYLNHYWAMVLIAVLLAVVPTDRAWSIALWRGRRGGARAGTPAWGLWLLRAQVAVVYVFAGAAKLDSDWLLRAQPLTTWLAARADLPFLGGLVAHPSTALVASWVGLLFDLTIVGWLWWRPTRAPAMAAVVAFHAATWWLFPAIGVFPWLMIGMATLWLPPEWPRAWRRRRATAPHHPPRPAAPARADSARAVPVPVLAGVALWIAVQVILPLRHLVIPGDVDWTEEGGRLSWRVMADEKVGWAVFHVTDPRSGATRDVPLVDVLTARQAHVAAVRPDLLHQVADLLADRAEADGRARPIVRVDAVVSWNGRTRAPLVDPRVDLAAAPWRYSGQSWLLAAPP